MSGTAGGSSEGADAGCKSKQQRRRGGEQQERRGAALVDGTVVVVGQKRRRAGDGDDGRQEGAEDGRENEQGKARGRRRGSGTEGAAVGQDGVSEQQQQLGGVVRMSKRVAALMLEGEHDTEHERERKCGKHDTVSTDTMYGSVWQ